MSILTPQQRLVLNTVSELAYEGRKYAEAWRPPIPLKFHPTPIAVIRLELARFNATPAENIDAAIVFAEDAGLLIRVEYTLNTAALIHPETEASTPIRWITADGHEARIERRNVDGFAWVSFSRKDQGAEGFIPWGGSIRIRLTDDGLTLPAVKLTPAGIAAIREDEVVTTETANPTPNGASLSPAGFAKALGITTDTLAGYVKRAGLKTPSRGKGRSHRYSPSDQVKIASFIVSAESMATTHTKGNARTLLQRLHSKAES